MGRCTVYAVVSVDRLSVTYEHNGRRTAPQYLFAGLVIGMAVTGALLTMWIPPFFGPDGGDPVIAGLLAFGFVAFMVAARIVRPSVVD